MILKRRIESVDNLKEELEKRILSEDKAATVNDGADKWVDALLLKSESDILTSAIQTRLSKEADKAGSRESGEDKWVSSKLLDDTTKTVEASVGQLTSVVEDHKTRLEQAENQIVAMAGGLNYKGTFNASEGTLPAGPVKLGDFYKVSESGTIDTLELAVGDMIIANKNKDEATTAADWDKVDNTESSDIIRIGNLSENEDWLIDGESLASRETIKKFVEKAVFEGGATPITESIVVNGEKITLTHKPKGGLNGIVFGVVRVMVDSAKGIYDEVEVTVNEKEVTLNYGTPDARYTGKTAKVCYFYSSN